MTRAVVLFVIAAFGAMLSASLAIAQDSAVPGSAPMQRFEASQPPRPPDLRDGERRHGQEQPPQPPAGSSQKPDVAPFRPQAGSTVPLPPAPAPIADDLDAIVPGEILVLSPSMDAAIALAQALAARGYAVVRRQTLEFLDGLVLSALRVPAGRSVADALQELERDFPDILAGPNARFELADEPRIYAHQLIEWPAKHPCVAGVSVGMVDTGVDVHHPALANQIVETQSFLPAGMTLAAPDHGTAVAALLAGDPSVPGFGGLLPKARIVAASVFARSGEHEARTTSERVALALDWLGDEGIRLVNLSLAGPRSEPVLETVVARAAEAGMVLVAAGGNFGPAAPPAYPAAYQPVIAVTAIDAAGAVYRKANQGAYLEFAAPGVDVWSARPEAGGQYRSGTSFAAPFVTAAAAIVLATAPGLGVDAVRAVLGKDARDLGEPGHDAVFGWGLLRAPACRETAHTAG